MHIDDMDKKYQAILDKLEEIATNKAEHKKLDTIIDQTRQLQDGLLKSKQMSKCYEVTLRK